MPEKGQQGVQSVEVGLKLVDALARSTGNLSLKDLAEAAGMSASKAHRYLVSLMRTGLVERVAPSGNYDLGPLALNVGLAALGRRDIQRFAWDELVKLRDEIDQSVAQAVWGDRGPVIVRWEEPSRPVIVNVRAGAVLPIVSSATGRLFAAFLPRGEVEPRIESEIADGVVMTSMGDRVSRAGFWDLLQDIRIRQMARARGDLTEGISALSGPVFDHRGDMVMAMVAMGTVGSFDLTWDGANAMALANSCRTLSERLGFRADDASSPADNTKLP